MEFLRTSRKKYRCKDQEDGAGHQGDDKPDDSEYHKRKTEPEEEVSFYAVVFNVYSAH